MWTVPRFDTRHKESNSSRNWNEFDQVLSLRQCLENPLSQSGTSFKQCYLFPRVFDSPHSCPHAPWIQRKVMGIYVTSEKWSLEMSMKIDFINSFYCRSSWTLSCNTLAVVWYWTDKFDFKTWFWVGVKIGWQHPSPETKEIISGEKVQKSFLQQATIWILLSQPGQMHTGIWTY